MFTRTTRRWRRSASRDIDQAVALTRTPGLTPAELAMLAALPVEYAPRALHCAGTLADNLFDAFPGTDAAAIQKIALHARAHVLACAAYYPTAYWGLRLTADSLAAAAVAMGELAVLDQAGTKIP